MSLQTASQFEIGSESEEYMKSLKSHTFHKLISMLVGAAALEMIYKYYGLNDVNQQELMKNIRNLSRMVLVISD